MSYMNDHNIDVSDLKGAYDKVVNAYDRIQESETDSFMNSEIQRYFADLDNTFLGKLWGTTNALVSQLKLKV